MPSPPFREGTVLRKTKVAFIYNAGGLGDWINWTTAIRYAIEVHPHLEGYVITRPHFAELADLWLGSYAPRFEVRTETVHDYFDLDYIQDLRVLIPDQRQYANTCGVNIFKLGFIYYNQTEKIPDGWNVLPYISGDEVDLSAFSLPKNYAVITPYATADNKRLEADALNQLSAWLPSVGITPVFLGKSEVTTDHRGAPPRTLNRNLGLDLTEKTSLVEAACIMANARFVLGADNGLLHLAACSKVPVIAAFTTVEPRMTVPPRRRDAKTLILTPPDSLKCRFCQNKMRHVYGHNFKYCLYDDNECTKAFTGSVLIESARKVIDAD
jgi:ADP-heptose:LPS heptosyltransferase